MFVTRGNQNGIHVNHCKCHEWFFIADDDTSPKKEKEKIVTDSMKLKKEGSNSKAHLKCQQTSMLSMHFEFKN